MHSRYGISIANILHPTDFSHGSEVAFAHALKIAVSSKGQLEILHVDRNQSRADWDKYPSVRDTLCKWGVLAAGAERSAVTRLGVSISKSACKGQDPATGMLEHLERRGADLVIMATHRREGIDRWLHQNLAESVANRTEAASLFIPYGVDGFVDLESGAVSLKCILVPIDSVPDPQPVIDAVAELVDAIAAHPVEIRLLHIGDPDSAPAPTLPTSDRCRWIWETRVGNVVERICDDALENDVDLIAMATNGHDGFLDILRESTSERVLHKANCPVLSVHGSGH